MTPRERTPRSVSRLGADRAPAPLAAAPPRGAARGAPRRRARLVLAGCALGVLMTDAGCAARRLPRVTLAVRHERGARAREHRVEIWLSRGSRRPPPIAGGHTVASTEWVDPCPDAPHCAARDLLVEAAERRFLGLDPDLRDPHLERRLDDLMVAPEADPSWEAPIEAAPEGGER